MDTGSEILDLVSASGKDATANIISTAQEPSCNFFVFPLYCLQNTKASCALRYAYPLKRMKKA